MKLSKVICFNDDLIKTYLTKIIKNLVSVKSIFTFSTANNRTTINFCKYFNFKQFRKELAGSFFLVSNIKEPIAHFNLYLDFTKKTPIVKEKIRYIRLKYLKKKINCYQTTFKKEKSIQRSIEEVLAQKISFHGQGREDADVSTIGSGRSAIIETRATLAKIITMPLKLFDKTDGQIILTIYDLRAGQRDIVMIKESKNIKKYLLYFRVLVELDLFSKKQLLQDFSKKNLTISQKTPNRLNKLLKTRYKKIFFQFLTRIEKNSITLTLFAESGTYIKEYITGDHQRTVPNCQDICQKYHLKFVKLVVKEII